MKITVEIPDDLFNQAKARASLEGIRLHDLVVCGLQLALEKPPDAARRSRTTFPLVKTTDGSRQITDAEVAEALANMDTEEAQR